ncbi:hypothetical protein LT85_4221 [Collimonas arenae]|uniref:Uncharacterized protein n=1 Tax=Collimonas arenae TaxID=279058 RepID=A0A0A1FIB6_9BURK|nr:hypothetical protein LT85_4221 [Collimonas arenae]
MAQQPALPELPLLAAMLQRVLWQPHPMPLQSEGNQVWPLPPPPVLRWDAALR